MIHTICRHIYKNMSKLDIYNKRLISLSRSTRSYEAEGKTTVNILNNDDEFGLMINGFSQVGFRLNNDVTVLGPMAIFSRSVMSWNVANINDINEESLSLFAVLEPKIDILVLGIGDKLEDRNFHKRLLPFSVKNKINLEILPTEQACSTFNFLNSEDRCVAGALLPPQTIETNENDVLQTKLRYQNLYVIE